MSPTPDPTPPPNPDPVAAPAARDTSRDGLFNQLEFWTLTHLGPMWRVFQSVEAVERRVNRVLIDQAVNKAAARPYRLSTLAPYTSWRSLTDKTYNARQLPPKPAGRRAPPPAEQVVALFARGDGLTLCPKSTVLFCYLAQWFTDGFLRSRRRLGQTRDIRRNESTHDVDLTELYGRTTEQTDLLRAHEGGRLASIELGGEEYPPRLCDPDGTVKVRFAGLPPVIGFENLSLEQKRQLFAMGSDAANSQIGYAMLNVLFLREHNRIAGQAAREHPEWDDERLFATARNVLVVLLIKLVIEEYINHIAPYHFKLKFQPQSFYDTRWYRANWTAVEFNLLYRWHSLVPTTLHVDGADLPLAGTIFNNDLITRRGLGPAFEDASRQRAGKVGLFNTDAWFAPRTTLPSILQSREVELPPYNDYRVDCKFPRVTDFDQISSDPRVQDGLREAYGHVEDVEFYVGLFAEDTRPNSVIPSLMGRMVALHAFSQLYTNPLLAPAIYNAQTFTASGMALIESTRSLSELLARNLPAGAPAYFVSLTRAGWRRT